MSDDECKPCIDGCACATAKRRPACAACGAPTGTECDPSIIRLNIGGVRYMTTAETLTRSSCFFSGLMSGRFYLPRDEQGYIFLDRDGRYFEPILEYLRTREWVTPRGMSLASVVREARFYGIEPPMYARTTVFSNDHRIWPGSLQEKTSLTHAHSDLSLLALCADGQRSLYMKYEETLNKAAEIILKGFRETAQKRGREGVRHPIFFSRPGIVGGSSRDVQVSNCVKAMDRLTQEGRCVFDDRIMEVLNRAVPALVWYLRSAHQITVKVDDGSVGYWMFGQQREGNSVEGFCQKDSPWILLYSRSNSDVVNYIIGVHFIWCPNDDLDDKLY